MDLNLTLATTNAVLTTTGGIFLLIGWYFIKQKEQAKHQKAMLAATITQGLFLISYLARILIGGTTPFPHEGVLRTIYFFVLVTHVALAAIQLPFIILVLWRAFRGQFALHRRVARYTLPMWLYVSFTGPVVYWMLHQM